MADPADLALVIEDELAPRVLAWWDKARPQLGSIDLVSASRMVRASPEEVEATIERCHLAGLISDDGIAPPARLWLAALTAKHLEELGVSVSPKKPAKERAKERAI